MQKGYTELPMTAFRRPTNIRDILVRSTTPPNDSSGFKPCNTPQCKTCPYTSSASSFRSSTNGRVFNITLNLSCHSHNIINLITCTKCNKYIGKTKKSLRTRFTSHRFEINNDRGTSVAKHFNIDDHTSQHVNIIAIDQLPGSDNISLLNKETHWFHTLGTTEPHGMNIKEQESFPISIRFK
ncbi:hypothetical protein ElyMa_002284400 [Elysia marginata]|uniref:GIY-YIG domain-containing protein n=1 Tax=Elysia marginata TaxID=1093978 RepID=A0AAV4G255_9GAST|nr:hypothetical protein ElyMa_002284400 [Elysia marginata]